jgi:hypothetical protein
VNGESVGTGFVVVFSIFTYRKRFTRAVGVALTPHLHPIEIPKQHITRIMAAIN